jgi:uncharacterized protein (DUF486 family)
LLTAIGMSWLVALAEYTFQGAPANRIGPTQLTLAQLKLSQECIRLVVFVIYAWLVCGEPIRWNTFASIG